MLKLDEYRQIRTTTEYFPASLLTSKFCRRATASAVTIISKMDARESDFLPTYRASQPAHNGNFSVIASKQITLSMIREPSITAKREQREADSAP